MRASSTEVALFLSRAKAAENFPDEIAGRVVFGIADNPRLTTQLTHHVALRHGLFRVIRPLAVDIWTQASQEPRNVVTLENEDTIDHVERGHNLRAIRRHSVSAAPLL